MNQNMIMTKKYWENKKTAYNTMYIQWRGLGVKPKVWDLFSNFTTEKRRVSLL
jgi:hypothetical protein